jgi:hypothetical protein
MIDHDRLFKELLPTFFAEFLELFLPEVAAYVDRRSLTFLDKEVFTDVTAGTKQEADLVVKARFRGQASFFLLHLEHSAQPRLLPPRRMFGYFAPLHAKHGLPVYPIALCSQGVMEPAPDEYRVAFPDLEVLRFRYRVIQLRRWRWRDFVRTPNPVASALMATMGMAPAERPREQTEVMELTTSWEERGRAEGLVEGSRQTVLRQLQRRWGRPAPAVAAKVRRMSTEEVQQLGEALFDLSTPADLKKWLAAH